MAGDQRTDEPRTTRSRPDRGSTFLRGAAVTVTDLSTMAMFVTAAKDIALGHLSLPTELLLFLLVLAITLVTAWLPPLMFVSDPTRTLRLLSPMAGVVRRRSRALGAMIAAAMGVYLLIRGALAL